MLSFLTLICLIVSREHVMAIPCTGCSCPYDHGNVSMAELSPRQNLTIQKETNQANVDGEEELSVPDECCICFRPQPLATFNRSEFLSLFQFDCPHSSSHICQNCWISLLNLQLLYRQKVRCPLCRKSRLSPNATPIVRHLIHSQSPVPIPIQQSMHQPRPAQRVQLMQQRTLSPPRQRRQTAINYPYGYSASHVSEYSCEILNGCICEWLCRSSELFYHSLCIMFSDFCAWRCLNFPMSLIIGCGIGIVGNLAATAIILPVSCCFCCDCCCHTRTREQSTSDCRNFLGVIESKWGVLWKWLNRYECDVWRRCDCEVDGQCECCRPHFY